MRVSGWQVAPTINYRRLQTSYTAGNAVQFGLHSGYCSITATEDYTVVHVQALAGLKAKQKQKPSDYFSFNEWLSR
jgi:hypothetical protein